MANCDEILHVTSGDRYLSVGDVKSKISCFFFDFDCQASFGGKISVAAMREPKHKGPQNIMDHSKYASMNNIDTLKAINCRYNFLAYYQRMKCSLGKGNSCGISGFAVYPVFL